MSLQQKLVDNICQAFKHLYAVDIDMDGVGLEHPQSMLWGDYSCNIAMTQAKTVGIIPTRLAEEVVDWLRMQDISAYFSQITVAGPGFINFLLNKEFLFTEMLSVLSEGDRFGSSTVGANRKIALEHSNVNPNKAAHVGHLRNAVIGQFLERVYKFAGYDIVVQYYSNDLGVQVSTSVLGFEVLENVIDRTKYDKFDHYAWDVYAKISTMLLEDADLKKKLDSIVVKLDNGDQEIVEKQKVLSKKILKDNLKTFGELDIDYNLIVHESSIKDFKMWEKAFEKLKKSDNVYKATDGDSKGCWLVRMNATVSEKGIEKDKIIVRSNNVPTYTGKDIAYHMWKFGLLDQDFKYQVADYGNQQMPLYETSLNGVDSDVYTNSNIVLDVIDVKQTYAIDAVRLALSYLGYEEQADKLIHVNYGHVYLSSGTMSKLGYSEHDSSAQTAMSGRKGIGVKIDDFIRMFDENLSISFGDFPNKKEVRNSAIKFGILKYDTFQDVIFDLDEALNLKGFTGPYIEYTHARTSSLLEKAQFQYDKDLASYVISKLKDEDVDPSCMEIIRLVHRFPKVILDSATKYAPNTLCTYLYDLCQKYNAFYNDTPVLKAENPNVREFRLLLTGSVRQVIKNGLYLLGIAAVDRM